MTDTPTIEQRAKDVALRLDNESYIAHRRLERATSIIASAHEAKYWHSLPVGATAQFRRIVKPQPLWVADPSVPFKTDDANPRGIIRCPYPSGTVLFCKEKWCEHMDNGYVFYAADGWPKEAGLCWRPSIHMPENAARTWLRVESVRVQRVQDITDDDASASGITSIGDVQLHPNANSGAYRCGFAVEWDSRHGKDAWRRNDYVWAVTVRKVERP